MEKRMKTFFKTNVFKERIAEFKVRDTPKDVKRFLTLCTKAHSIKRTAEIMRCSVPTLKAWMKSLNIKSSKTRGGNNNPWGRGGKPTRDKSRGEQGNANAGDKRL